MKLIERTFYLDKLKDVMGTPDIKVITGMRRSGKSKLLEMFIGYVRQKDTNANIIHINYSLSEYEPLLEYHRLNEYVEKAYREGKTNYIFIDEVQMCEGFEKPSTISTLLKNTIFISLAPMHSCLVLTLQHYLRAEPLKLRFFRFICRIHAVLCAFGSVRGIYPLSDGRRHGRVISLQNTRGEI